MRNFLKTLALLAAAALFLFLTPRGSLFVKAETQEERLARLENEIKQYESEITRLSQEASTLANQIAQYDAQIRLTSLRIAETEEKIFLLGGRIDQLETSLAALSEAFKTRVVQTYKMSRAGEPYLFMLTSDDLSEAVSSYYYLKKIQEADRGLLVRLEQAQVNYQVQKDDQEVLQTQLEGQKSVLGAQKIAKAQLLETTKNDEKKYQQLLGQARSEFEAIQAILAGKGTEEQVGQVAQGAKIATIIQGPSCNSSGAHVHFIAKQGSITLNPFSYLKPGVDFENCSGSSCGSSEGDSFNPTGSWEWPINPKIKFSQGYGATWATKNTWVGKIYSSHNGIDIGSPSPDVKAVQSGTLYRGSYGGSGGCRLRYVRIDHDNSDIDTFYLHINY